MLDNLLVVEKKTGKQHPWLAISNDAPTGLTYLYEIFAELSLSRRIGMSGAEPIGTDQIYFWQLASGFKLRAWERMLLARVDSLWRQVQQKDYKGPQLGDNDGD